MTEIIRILCNAFNQTNPTKEQQILFVETCYENYKEGQDSVVHCNTDIDNILQDVQTDTLEEEINL